MKSGLIVLHKEEGMTSQRAVTLVKRLFGADKAGHTGTLDPMATGVLPILIGRAVKAGEYLLSSDKHYLAVMRLGMTSDTEDISGTCIATNAPLPDEACVLRTVQSFIGTVQQTPPMYSALKVGGRKLVDLARCGIEIERPSREIRIFSLCAERLNDTDYRLDVVCSKGTYIRTLCADIGTALGCGAVMASLCRAEAAGYTLEDAHTIDELTAMTEEQRDACIHSTESLFSRYPSLTLPPFFARLARCGVEIYLKKIGCHASLGDRFRLTDERGFFALGEVRAFDDGLAVKPIKQFDV